MTATKAAIDDLVQWFVKPGPNGVVGLADDLVRYCAENNLLIHLTDSICEIIDESGEHQVARHGLPKYALRALLVRMTVLCENTKEINPYGGAGLIKLTDATVSMRMSNTNAQLALELKPFKDNTNPKLLFHREILDSKAEYIPFRLNLSDQESVSGWFLDDADRIDVGGG